MATEFHQATGRRKTSTARVRLVAGGDGKITCNGRSFEEYFPTETLQQVVTKPLEKVEKKGAVTIACNLDGGGVAGQAGALSHGISRALLKLDASLRGTLKKEGLLERDARMKERKKPGQPGARKRFQYSKR